jgi:hypothetical protein
MGERKMTAQNKRKAILKAVKNATETMPESCVDMVYKLVADAAVTEFILVVKK